MIIERIKSGLILDKPAGIATHTPDGGTTPGFLEMASRLLETPLWAVHRLDRDTSGCLLVSTNPEDVKEWSDKLSHGQKKYIFLSHKDANEGVWSFEGCIEKTGNHRFELVKGKPNSFTRFGRLGAWGPYFLFEAEIFSGKTHQIRLHAQACGIPILGDKEHGGKEFFRLMLHAQDLDLDGHKVHGPRPFIFELVRESKNPYFKFGISLDRRRFLRRHLELSATDAFRLVHREWSLKTGFKLCVEKLGPCLQILNYSEQDLPRDFVDALAAFTHTKHYIVRKMFNRGKTADQSNIQLTSPLIPLSWTITENQMRFEMRSSQGLSSGIFLDQRENRRLILKNSHSLKVANLFCYTGGFSVAAAKGGASEVVSVDSSKTAIEWARANFVHNDLVPDRFEFFVADSQFFLKSCKKRGRKFDLIILDPPTFSRGKNGIFKIQEQFKDLLLSSHSILSPQGRILFTMNDETIKQSWIKSQIEDALKGLKYKLDPIIPPYDFEFPLERDTVLKGYWLSFL